MVAPQPAVPGLPTARVRRRGFRGLRTHFPEPAPNAPRRRIGVHGVRRNDADAADLVRQPCVVRPPGLARGHLVHADRQGPADSVHRAAPPVESRVRRQRAAVDRRLVVPRAAAAEVDARRRWAETSRNRGGARRHLERHRDRRDARRALLRGARLAFRLTGAFFFRGAFLARALFGAGAFFGGGAFAGGSRSGPSIGMSLYTKSFSST